MSPASSAPALLLPDGRILDLPELPAGASRVAVRETWRGVNEVRITPSVYRQKAYVGVRTWYTTDGTTWCPTRKGVNVTAEELPALIEALQRAQEHLVRTQAGAAQHEDGGKRA